MTNPILRRRFLQTAPFTLAALHAAPEIPASFPQQEPDLVREVVGVSHNNLKRVKELVLARPSLAKASWDWGFGDWETALGAASHVGNRDIATFLIEQGAPPTLCSAVMLGQLDVVKATIAASPGIQRIPGPHSLSLLSHAKAGGAQALEVRKFLESLGDADGQATPAHTPEEFIGIYKYGDGRDIEIGIRIGRLQMTMKSAGSRFLVPVGARSYHPVGAHAVRIQFAPDTTGMLMTIHDASLVVTARRAS